MNDKVYDGIYLGLTVSTAQELESKRLIVVTQETVDHLTKRVNELEKENKRLQELLDTANKELWHDRM
jgi:cell shape-determining protein MreC